MIRRTAPPRGRTASPAGRAAPPCCRTAIASVRVSGQCAGRDRFADDAHLGLERDTVHALDCVLHVADQLFELGGAGMAVIDDEVGMFFRHYGIADAIALEAGGIDQARGMIRGRVLEHRAAAPASERLGLAATLSERTLAIARLDGAFGDETWRHVI